MSMTTCELQQMHQAKRDLVANLARVLRGAELGVVDMAYEWNAYGEVVDIQYRGGVGRLVNVTRDSKEELLLDVLHAVLDDRGNKGRR